MTLHHLVELLSNTEVFMIRLACFILVALVLYRIIRAEVLK